VSCVLANTIDRKLRKAPTLRIIDRTPETTTAVTSIDWTLKPSRMTRMISGIKKGVNVNQPLSSDSQAYILPEVPTRIAYSRASKATETGFESCELGKVFLELCDVGFRWRPGTLDI